MPDESAMTTPAAMGRAIANALQQILDAPPLTLAVRDGGLPEELTIVPSNAVIVPRVQIQTVIDHLRSTEET